MDIKPIKTEKNYNDTLNRIDTFMDPTPNTKEFYELDILTTLVEAYEEILHKIEVPDQLKLLSLEICDYNK